ncbi:unnamed protein product, partial [Adineta ricciae]
QQHASERWINGNTKACPKCHAHIEKNEGCDHMTCAKCKHEFCWQCLVSYAGIKRHGAYLHHRSCVHYPPTETRSEYYAISLGGQEHWARVIWNKMHIKRTSPLACYGCTGIWMGSYSRSHSKTHEKRENRTKFSLNNSQNQTVMTSNSGAEKSLPNNLLRGIPDFILAAGRLTEAEHNIVKETTDWNVPVFLVRSKAKIDCESWKRRKIEESEVKKNIRKNLNGNEILPTNMYVIDTHHPDLFEYKKFKQALLR